MSRKLKSAAGNQDAKPALTPKLRFPEFRDAPAWEEKTLETRGKFTGGGTPSKENATHWTGEIPWVSSSDISEDSISEIKITRFITEEAIRESATKIVPANSILLISRVGVGKLAVTTKPICTSQDFTSFTPAEDDLLFLAYFLKRHKETLHSFNQGTSIKGFTKDNIASLELGFPSCPEQQKIASCLTTLDEVIAAQSQKLDALKTHKKGLMQQLFPHEGETLPRLRFPEFQDAPAWEIQPFKKLFSIGNGRDHKHLSKGNVPVYGSGGYMRSVDEHLYDGESVCIGRKGTINNPMFLTGKFWTVDTLFYTHSFNECLPKFIYAIFQNINWLKHNEAGGVPSLSKANIEKIEVAAPKPPEQQKIAECLTSLDELIAAQRAKLEALKTHKKGLMQQLFPSPTEVEA